MKVIAVVLSFLTMLHPTFSQKSTITYPNSGSIYQNAKHIDADRLFPFSQGAAVIKKGNSEALIDSSGSFILPFNKLRLMSARQVADQQIDGGTFDMAGSNGILAAAPSNGDGLHFTQLINSKGKVIYTAPAGYQIAPTSGRGGNDAADAPYMSRVFSINKKTSDLTRFLDDVGINADGTAASFKIISNYSSYQWGGEGLYVYLDESVKNIRKWGYKDKKGNVVIKPQYEYARKFSEGLAAVGKKDEYGEVKWGYINTKGTVVIPFKYSNEPGDFGDGLAVVSPKTITEFKYAFIDKTGETKFTIDTDSPLNIEMPIPGQGYINKFRNGYIVCYSNTSRDLCLVDKKQMAYSQKDILRWFGLQGDSLEIKFFPYYNNQMYYLNRHTGKYGLLNFADKTALPAIFSSLSLFDPVSNLAYAKFSIGKDPKNSQKDQYIEGYINRQGVFVIVKKAETTW